MNEMRRNAVPTPAESHPWDVRGTLPRWLVPTLLVAVALLMVLPAGSLAQPSAAGPHPGAPMAAPAAVGATSLAPVLRSAASAVSGAPSFSALPLSAHPEILAGTPVAASPTALFGPYAHGARPAGLSTPTNSYISNMTGSTTITRAGPSSNDLVVGENNLYDFLNGTSNSAYNPVYLFSGTFWSSGIDPAAYSTNGGQSWTLSYPGLNSSWTNPSDPAYGSIHVGNVAIGGNGSGLVLLADSYGQPCVYFGAAASTDCNSTQGFGAPGGVAIARSTDGGISWSHVAVVNGFAVEKSLTINIAGCAPYTGYFNGNYTSSVPSIAVSPNGLDVTVWFIMVEYNYAGDFICSGGTLYYAHAYAPPVVEEYTTSTDGGITWSTPTTWSDNQSAYQSSAVGPTPKDIQYTAFIDYDNYSTTTGMLPIDLTTSTDNGSTWSVPHGIPGMNIVYVAGIPPDGYPAISPVQLASDTWASSPYKGDLYLIWADNRSYSDGEPSVAFASSSNGGSSWTAPIYITPNTTGSVMYAAPQISVDSNGVIYVTFYAVNAISGYFTYSGVASSNGGRTWSAVYPVADQASTPWQITYASFGATTGVVGTTNGAYATWTDCRAAVACTTQEFIASWWGMGANLQSVALRSNVPGVTATVVAPGGTSQFSLNASTVWLNGSSVTISVPSFVADPQSTSNVFAFANWTGLTTSSNPVDSFQYTGGNVLEAQYVEVPGSWVTGTVGPDVAALAVTVGGTPVPLTPTGSGTATFNETVAVGSYTVDVSAGIYYIPYQTEVATSKYAAVAVNDVLAKTSGWISGTVTPVTAMINVSNGVTNMTVPVSSGSFNTSVVWGSYTVWASLAGYTLYSDPVNVSPFHTSSVRASVVGVHISGSIALTGSGSITTAIVRVDGVTQQLTAGTFLTTQLPGGEHLVTATAPGYNLYSQEINVVAPNTAHVDITLTNMGWINGTVNPSGAIVQIGGKDIGVLPTSGVFNRTETGAASPGQSYELVAILSGYNTTYKNVTVTPGNVSYVTITMGKAIPVQTQNCTNTPSLCPAKNNSNGPNDLLLYVAIGVVIALVVAIAVVMLMRRRGGDSAPAEATTAPEAPEGNPPTGPA